jgi:integrase/recombinase XerD
MKIKTLKDKENNLMVSFPYNPQFVEKIKSIKGHRCHPERKYWGFPNSNEILEKILEVFEYEKIYIDPIVQSEDLLIGLLLRKNSYKTVKAYIYFNRDFLNFIKKNSSEINNNIKDYLVYFFEKKRVSTSTLNQAINVLKFYHGN